MEERSGREDSFAPQNRIHGLLRAVERIPMDSRVAAVTPPLPGALRAENLRATPPLPMDSQYSSRTGCMPG